jgi:hypothetical protein
VAKVNGAGAARLAVFGLTGWTAHPESDSMKRTIEEHTAWRLDMAVLQDEQARAVLSLLLVFTIAPALI